MTVATGAVGEAITELEGEFSEVNAEEDGEGGAYVAVGGIETLSRWLPELLTIEFRVLFNYPHAAIYPFYTTPDLQLADGGLLPQAIQRVEWRGRALTQISLNSPRWSPQHDSAISKVKQVSRWLQTGEL
jgi:Prokaryotic E2 family E